MDLSMRVILSFRMSSDHNISLKYVHSFILLMQYSRICVIKLKLYINKQKDIAHEKLLKNIR